MKKSDICVFEYTSTDSTNTRAKEYAKASGKLPALFIAEEQTQGRGRMGRSFYSPASTGLYMTLLFNAPQNAEKTVTVTSLCAVAASAALKSAFGVDADIKWVNDLYINGRKVAGILAESFIEKDVRMVAIGVGINISTSDFPDDIKDRAGAVGVKSVSKKAKRKLALDIARRLMELAESDDVSAAMDEYRARSCVIGKKVSFTQNGKTDEGKAVGITDNGFLQVALPTGHIITLSGGEISLSVEE